MNPQTNELQTDWAWLMDFWLHEKQRAKKTGDYSLYVWFLKEVRKEFSRIYAGFTNDGWIALFDQVFQTITCELKEIVIKSNNMAKKKLIREMTDTELLHAYKIGTQWLFDKQQVTNTSKAENGDSYNDEEWQKGLKRLERLENEMNKRGLVF